MSFNSHDSLFIKFVKTTTLTLVEFIKDHLLFNDSVTLPGLGSFEIRKKASRITGTRIIPPGLEIVFNTERSLDDGSLSKAIASAEEIPEEEAGQRVLELIDEILFAINKGEECNLKGFGKLYRDQDNVLRFLKDPDFRIEYESYGLEAFELDPLEELMKPGDPDNPQSGAEPDGEQGKGRTQPKNGKKGKQDEKQVKSGIPGTPEKIKSNRNLYWILTGTAAIILVTFVLIKMTTDLFDRPVISNLQTSLEDEQDIFSENENEDFNKASNTRNELSAAIDSLAKQEYALGINESEEPKISSSPGTAAYIEYHIIAGSFKDSIKAGMLQQSLTEKGYPAIVIHQGDHLYRVSAMSFRDKTKGLAELERFRLRTKNRAAWLLGLK